MNITSLRPKFIKYTEPIASFFIRLGVTPNQVSALSVLFGFSCALAFAQRYFLAGSLLLVVSAILDLVEGAMEGGAAGISIGRNAFQHSAPDRLIRAAALIIHEGRSAEEAMEILRT